MFTVLCKPWLYCAATQLFGHDLFALPWHSVIGSNEHVPIESPAPLSTMLLSYLCQQCLLRGMYMLKLLISRRLT